jgi:hypothetical protein
MSSGYNHCDDGARQISTFLPHCSHLSRQQVETHEEGGKEGKKISLLTIDEGKPSGRFALVK